MMVSQPVPKWAFFLEKKNFLRWCQSIGDPLLNSKGLIDTIAKFCDVFRIIRSQLGISSTISRDSKVKMKVQGKISRKQPVDTCFIGTLSLEQTNSIVFFVLFINVYVTWDILTTLRGNSNMFGATGSSLG